MTAPATSARALFLAEVRRPDHDLDLARAALLVAKEEYPALSVEHYLARLDQLAEEVRGRLADETAPMVVLEELTRTLFERGGLRGNADEYHDPRNSFLNDVLDRRLGIPLTLSMIMLEVGWRVGLPLRGINFPHHFLVRFRGDALDLIIDPFDGGRARYEHQAQELVDRVHGPGMTLDPSHLRFATKRDMLIRLLANLKGVYLNARDSPRTLAVVERLIALREDGADHRVRAVLLARLRRREEAVACLRDWLEVASAGRDTELARRLLERLTGGRRSPEGGG